MTLYEKLKEYGESDHYGFHMPGHKRNREFMGEDLPYELDITEIEGFDDLHHCEGILKEAQERAAKVYGAEETHFLVNGSTAGILSALAGCTKRGDAVLIARHCHKSVYHAVEMFGLKPCYVYAEKRGEDRSMVLNGRIYADTVDQILRERNDIKAVMIVSPTYDGVVSDIRAIAKTVHAYGIPLIVDEAHGAHFGFHGYFPENANRLGADVVIHSVHKTLPALTQSALLHMNGTIADRQRIRKYLHMLQSSSPSYILMAGIDACVRMLDERKEEVFEAYAEKLRWIRKELKGLKNLALEEIPQYDRSKLVLSTRGADLSSKELSDRLLRTYHLQMEMTAGDYTLAMTSVSDTWHGLKRLRDALFEIDGRAGKAESIKEPYILPKLKQIVFSWEAEERGNGRRKNVEFEDCGGYVSADYAYLYPPGSPLVVPGELLSDEASALLVRYREMGFSIEGTSEENRIGVWING